VVGLYEATDLLAQSSKSVLFKRYGKVERLAAIIERSWIRVSWRGGLQEPTTHVGRDQALIVAIHNRV
jgi:hypothetical protein